MNKSNESGVGVESFNQDATVEHVIPAKAGSPEDETG